MIRFQPDTVPQALMRFFNMAAPDANVYIEIAAPDIRFAAVLLLAAVALLFWRRLGSGRQATMAMLLLLLASSAIWVRTTGNGRYFMALLVAVGPVAVGLICLLPVTRVFKATLALLLLGGQVFVISQYPPWNSWTYLHWKDGSYFQVSLGPEETRAPPTTYVSLSTISYSLIAPQFPPESRWINLATGNARDVEWIDAFLRDAAARGPMRAIAPSLPWASLPDARPAPRAVVAIDELLMRRNLRISGECRYIPSGGLRQMAERENSANADAPHAPGFWSCPIVYEPRPRERQRLEQAPEEVQRSLVRLGELCPRFFTPGESNLVRLPDAWSRHYAASETRVYVTDSREVWYKFWRSLNPVLVGGIDDLLAGKVQLDCAGIRGSDGAWKSGAQ